jgi:hypothetical protein
LFANILFVLYIFKRIPQIAGFSNLDGTVAGFNRGIVWPIPYETQEDGITFDLKPVFWSAIPDTFKNAKTPLQKSNNTPHMILLCGNAKHLKENYVNEDETEDEDA